MSISSEEINLLIQHYLQELGYSHAAFAFGCESQIPLHEIAKKKVQPGSLVYLVQKGIMLAHMEAAAEKALDNPAVQFSHQLTLLHNNLRQCTEQIDELCAATRRVKIFPTEDQTEIKPAYLNSQLALFLQAHQTPALVCSWDKTSRYLATGSAGGSILVWYFQSIASPSLPTPTCIVHHVGTIQFNNDNAEESNDITSLAWSNPINENEPVILASGNFSGHIKFYDTKFSEVNSISSHNSPIVDMHFNSDGTKLLSTGSQGTITVVSLDRENYSTTLLGNWDTKQEIANSVWCSKDPSNTSFLVASGSYVYKGSIDDTSLTQIFTSSSSIMQLITNSSHDMFVIGDTNGSINVFKSDVNTNIYSNILHLGCICYISCSTLPFNFATGGADGLVKCVKLEYDKENNKFSNEVIEFKGHTSSVYAIAYDPLDRYIASAAKETINIWSFNGNSLIITYIATCPVITLSWSHDGRFLVVGLASGEVAVIDFEQLC